MKRRSAKKNRANVVKQLAESQMEELTDKEFEERFIEEHYPEKQKTAVKSPRRWSVVMSALACLVIVAIVIPCAIFLQPSSQTDPAPPNSEAGVPEPPQTDIVPPDSGTVTPEPPEEEDPPHFGHIETGTYTKHSNMDELNKELQGYYFNSELIGKGNIDLIYDKETDEKLFYSFACDTGNDSTIIGCTMYLVVNENYEGAPWWIYNWDRTLTVNGLTVQYNCQREEYYPEDGVYDYIYNAMIQIGGTKLFLKPYSCISYYDDSGFEKFVSELLVPVSETEPAYVSE